MDNPIEQVIDLGLVNYIKHPDDPNYVVFRFADPKRAESFESELTRLDIWFEKGFEERKQRTYTLFGIHKRDFKQVEKINYSVEAKHKKPFIPFKAFRWFLILVSAAAMTLAVLGYCKAQNKLRSSNEAIQTIDSTK